MTRASEDALKACPACGKKAGKLVDRRPDALSLCCGLRCLRLDYRLGEDRRSGREALERGEEDLVTI